MTRAERVRAIRDHALTIRAGERKFVAVGGSKLATWQGEGFIIIYRTPFANIRPDDLALARQMGKAPLPYGLDINAPSKVLNIEWEGVEDPLIVSFRRGEWEDRFLALL